VNTIHPCEHHNHYTGQAAIRAYRNARERAKQGKILPPGARATGHANRCNRCGEHLAEPHHPNCQP